MDWFTSYTTVNKSRKNFSYSYNIKRKYTSKLSILRQYVLKGNTNIILEIKVNIMSLLSSCLVGTENDRNVLGYFCVCPLKILKKVFFYRTCKEIHSTHVTRPDHLVSIIVNKKFRYIIKDLTYIMSHHTYL